MNRRSCRFAALLAVVALLFAQAMASVHACDQLGGVKMPAAPMAATQPDGDCCDHDSAPTDPLCDNHCQQGKQAPEPGKTASVPPLAAVGFVISTATVSWPACMTAPSAAPDLSRDTAPPIPIRNCCFRI